MRTMRIMKSSLIQLNKDKPNGQVLFSNTLILIIFMEFKTHWGSSVRNNLMRVAFLRDREVSLLINYAL